MFAAEAEIRGSKEKKIFPTLERERREIVAIHSSRCLWGFFFLIFINYLCN